MPDGVKAGGGRVGRCWEASREDVLPAAHSCLQAATNSFFSLICT